MRQLSTRDQTIQNLTALSHCSAVNNEQTSYTIHERPQNYKCKTIQTKKLTGIECTKINEKRYITQQPKSKTTESDSNFIPSITRICNFILLKINKLLKCCLFFLLIAYFCFVYSFLYLQQIFVFVLSNM